MMKNTSKENGKLRMEFFKGGGDINGNPKTPAKNKTNIENLKKCFEAGQEIVKADFPFFLEPLDQPSYICYCGHFKLIVIEMMNIPETDDRADEKERCAKVILELTKYDEGFFQLIKERTGSNQM